MTHKYYQIVYGEIRRVEPGVKPEDADLILHDHGDMLCHECRTKTLNELNSLAERLAAVTAENDRRGKKLIAGAELVGMLMANASLPVPNANNPDDPAHEFLRALSQATLDFYKGNES